MVLLARLSQWIVLEDSGMNLRVINYLRVSAAWS